MKSNKKGKNYLHCDLVKENGEVFTFALKPMFLNKKQYAYLMRLLGGSKHETK